MCDKKKTGNNSKQEKRPSSQKKEGRRINLGEGAGVKKNDKGGKTTGSTGPRKLTE